ncbi:MAG: ribosome maturation factor RimP [bacterium]|nr:ribosome maturation factor RimP [bacterium]
MGRVEETVSELAEPIASRLGLELVEVEYRKEAGDWRLRVVLDKDGGVGVDDCQAFSQELGPVLDRADPVPHTYLLEVSSPGIERPLKKEADFERFAGRRVAVATFSPVEGRKRFSGELLGVDGGQVRVRLNDGEELAIPLAAIAKAKLAPEF